MALKLVVDSLDGVDETLHSVYQQKDDGKYHLSVDGLEDTTGLKKNMAALLAEKRQLQEKYKQFDDIDPNEAKEAMEKLRRIKENELIASGDVEKVIENRTKLMKQDHENQVKQMTEAQDKISAENQRLKSALNKAVIERGILDAANEVGQPRKEALTDIVARGNGTWQLDDDGKPVPLNSDGTTIYGKDGKLPMTMVEWAESLREGAPHLWIESKGGGARGSVVTDGKGRKFSQEELAGMSPTAKANVARGL